MRSYDNLFSEEDILNYSHIGCVELAQSTVFFEECGSTALSVKEIEGTVVSNENACNELKQLRHTLQHKSKILKMQRLFLIRLEIFGYFRSFVY